MEGEQARARARAQAQSGSRDCHTDSRKPTTAILWFCDVYLIVGQINKDPVGWSPLTSSSSFPTNLNPVTNIYLFIIIFLLIFLFKERISRKCAFGLVHNAHSLCLLHTGTCSSTQACQILKIERLQCKIILYYYKKCHTRHNGYSLRVSELAYLFARAWVDPFALWMRRVWLQTDLHLHAQHFHTQQLHTQHLHTQHLHTQHLHTQHCTLSTWHTQHLHAQHLHANTCNAQTLGLQFVSNASDVTGSRKCKQRLQVLSVQVQVCLPDPIALDTRSVFALNYAVYIANSAIARAQLALKGNGR